jgi:DNA-directed RNA polymerase subunit RPC12/RpoP
MKINVDLEELRECSDCGVVFIPKNSIVMGDLGGQTSTYVCPCCKHIMVIKMKTKVFNCFNDFVFYLEDLTMNQQKLIKKGKFKLERVI